MFLQLDDESTAPPLPPALSRERLKRAFHTPQPGEQRHARITDTYMLANSQRHRTPLQAGVSVRTVAMRIPGGTVATGILRRKGFKKPFVGITAKEEPPHQRACSNREQVFEKEWAKTSEGGISWSSCYGINCHVNVNTCLVK